jgi:GNAT superfamily N-acetyltransferase
MQGVSIENFRGDAQALATMAHTAWRDEYGVDSYPNLYRPDYLAYLLQAVDDPRLVMAAYRGDEIVGFLLNLPRRMALEGREYRAALSCLLVTRREFFRQGLAQALIQEALKRNQELRFDFTLFYLETGHRSSRLFAKLRDTGLPIERVKRMHVIGRVLDLPALQASEHVKGYEVLALRLWGGHRVPAGAAHPEVRPAGPEDAPKILPLLNGHQEKVRLARVFSQEELVRELIQPPIAHTLVWGRAGEVQAVLAYVIVEHVGRKRVPWAWINHVVWDELSFPERVSLLKSFLRQAHEQGCAGVVEWSKQVYPNRALYAARFVPYPRQVDLMAWRFRQDISLAGIPDVYEVQI